MRICQHCSVEGDWSRSWWKGLKALGHHSKMTRISCLELFVSVSVFYILSTQALEEFLAQEEGWVALRFSTWKQKVQLRIAVKQNYVRITWKSEITLVNVLVVSWHPIPSVYTASCLLRGLRCNLLRVTSCKGAEPLASRSSLGMVCCRSDVGVFLRPLQQ